MKSIYMIICDNGDGSQHIEWHLTMSQDKKDFLEKSDEMYHSGDGVQVTELKFSDSFDFAQFAQHNRITWYKN